MLNTLAVFGILLSLLDGLIVRCPEGSGASSSNPCRISGAQLQDDTNVIIDISSDILFAEVFCDLKGCEKKVTGFFGAQLTRIVARTADGALGSRFYCGRGPPDSNQGNYRGNGTWTPKCILDATRNTPGTAQESEFIVFAPAIGEVIVTGDDAFGGALYRCYSDICTLNCGVNSCGGTQIEGNVTCTGECNDIVSPSVGTPSLIAEPDINGDCILNPSDIAATPFGTKIVFTNKCVTAILNCADIPGVCEKREIFCAAQEICLIQCGGEDIQKLSEVPVPLIPGACKEASITLGPFIFNRPTGTTEDDFDRPIDISGQPILLNAVVIFVGSDAATKTTVDAVLTAAMITANGATTFSEGKVTCGFDDTVSPSARAALISTCKLECIDGNLPSESACIGCSFVVNNAMFTSFGSACTDAKITNRMGITQTLSDNYIHISKHGHINKSSFWICIAILCISITLILIAMCIYKKHRYYAEKSKLITHHDLISGNIQPL